MSTENVGVQSVNVNNGTTISPARDEAGARVNDAVARIGRVGVIYDNARENRASGDVEAVVGGGKGNEG